jgi:hypothetical protein
VALTLEEAGKAQALDGAQIEVRRTGLAMQSSSIQYQSY